MVLEVLKYILIVLGIIVVGAFIIYALASLMLAIVDPNAKNKDKNEQNGNVQTITYEQPKLLAQPQQEPVVEQKVEKEEFKDVDLDKAKEEELALSKGNSFSALSEEEDAFIKEKQKNIEERINAKKVQTQEEEINIDDIFVDNTEEEDQVNLLTDTEEETDEDIEALIDKILGDAGVEEDDDSNEQTESQEPAVQEEPIVEQPAVEEPVVEEPVAEEPVVEETPQEPVVQESNEQTEQELKIQELQAELARQKEEYENKLAENIKAQEQVANQIEELQKELEEKDNLLKDAENKPTGAMLTLEEYQTRLETLKDRLSVNEKELRSVKKEYLPLSKIKKSLEKNKAKLRRKETSVANQKTMLYGVNNYVDLDEERAKKLAEDLDLLDGLRLSVQHCEEVLKANEERYPILENSYNILLSTNEQLKADIAECSAKIDELKSE